MRSSLVSALCSRVGSPSARGPNSYRRLNVQRPPRGILLLPVARTYESIQLAGCGHPMPITRVSGDSSSFLKLKHRRRSVPDGSDFCSHSALGVTTELRSTREYMDSSRVCLIGRSAALSTLKVRLPHGIVRAIVYIHSE
ncbi:hypothetical protein K466DRAFT_144878 [Polyporus arcularius HHB13444]|uniref:Uncharacterized protein n=1 Tax=Polyporus arcularius HHB13444 TaxID=1314778 RepID=A0A5C3PCI3_9APHY|nr:hypothetical protein K466DRAFT_144878 [Polyporus arcularius HHB13444]